MIERTLDDITRDYIDQAVERASQQASANQLASAVTGSYDPRRESRIMAVHVVAGFPDWLSPATPEDFVATCGRIESYVMGDDPKPEPANETEDTVVEEAVAQADGDTVEGGEAGWRGVLNDEQFAKAEAACDPFTPHTAIADQPDEAVRTVIDATDDQPEPNGAAHESWLGY